MALAVKHQTLKKKLISLLLLVFLPIIGIQGYIYYDRFTFRTSEELQANLELARAVGLAFDNFVKDVLHQELAIGLAATSAPPFSLTELTTLLRRSVEEYPPVRGLHWVGTDGRILAANNPEAIGLDVSDRDYFREIVSGREWVVSDLIISKTTGRPVFAIARSVRDAQGQLLGIALASVDPDRMDTVLAIERAKDAGVSLLDRNGMHVARHPVTEFTWEQRNWKKWYPEVEQALRGEEIATTVTSVSTGKKRLAGFVPVHSIGWVAAASRARDEAFRPIISNLITHLSLFLLVTLGAFIFALTLSRRISESIASLRDHALALGRGEPPKLQSSTLAEVQEVASAFNEMARKVQEREAALRESEERLRLAKSAGKIGIHDYRPASGMLFWDERLRHLWGLGPDDPVNYEVFMAGVHPEDRESTDAAVQRALDPAGDGKCEVEYRLVRDDRTYWIAATGQASFEGGRAVRFVGTVQDITERKRAEEALRQLNETLEQRVAERTKLAENRAGQLQALVSEVTLAEQRERRRLAEILHDHLQQLLVAAKMNCELLSARIDGKEKQAANNVIDLITQSIQTSRSLTVELSPAVLKEGRLSAALKWLAGWMLEKHGFHVDLDLDSTMDPEQEDITVLLFQSIRELLFNAVKHAGVKSARVEMSGNDRNRLCLSVVDQGTGFDPDTLLKGQSGAGFGLFSIRERLALMGGNLEIESAPGSGARFSMTIPLQAAVKNEGKKIRVLIADDHSVVRRGLSSFLNSVSGIEIIGEASDGEAAVRMAREVKPDVILMDIDMPNMDGLEATRIIHSEYPHTRIIGLSMLNAEEKSAQMIAVGASAYCSKDGDTEILLSAIRGEATL